MRMNNITRRTFLQQMGFVGATGVALARCGAADDRGLAASQVTAAGDSRVIRTALKELAFAMNAAPFAGRIVVGVADETPEAKSLSDAGINVLDRVPKDRDAYVVLMRENVLYLLGNTPRGLLHAVFALQEVAAGGEKLQNGFRREGVFHFRQRIFHSRFQGGPGERADIRYIAHLGATHCPVCHDWDGSRRSLQGYVTSPVFPKAVGAETVANNHAALRRLLDDCSDCRLAGVGDGSSCAVQCVFLVAAAVAGVVWKSRDGAAAGFVRHRRTARQQTPASRCRGRNRF